MKKFLMDMEDAYAFFMKEAYAEVESAQRKTKRHIIDDYIEKLEECRFTLSLRITDEYWGKGNAGSFQLLVDYNMLLCQKHKKDLDAYWHFLILSEEG